MQRRNWFVSKIGILSKSPKKKKSKSGWEIRQETQIKNLRKQAKMIKQRKDAGIRRDKKKKKKGKVNTRKNNNTT